MVRRALVLLTLLVLLAWAVSGCNMGSSTEDLEGTIVARVVATLEGAETASAATQVPPEPTATPVPEPTAIPQPTVTQVPPEPTATPVPEPTAILQPTATPPPQIEMEEYAVYSAMIQQNPIGFNLGSSIVIRGQTVSDLDILEQALEQGNPLPAPLVDSYRSRNTALYTLDPNLDVDLDYALMPEEEFEEIFFRRQGSVWAEFEDRYPEARGIVIFSRVGFGANGDEALVLMGYRCGDLCGAGGLYLLAKEEGSWKIQEPLVVWIS